MSAHCNGDLPMLIFALATALLSVIVRGLPLISQDNKQYYKLETLLSSDLNLPNCFKYLLPVETSIFPVTHARSNFFSANYEKKTKIELPASRFDTHVRCAQRFNAESNKANSTFA